MEEGDKRVSLKIDLTTGTIELNAPAESFNEAIEKTRELAATLDLQGRSSPRAPEVAAPVTATPATVIADVSLPTTSANRPRSKAVRSGERAGRLGSYEPIPQLLTDEQQMDLMVFMSEKSPSDQADRVLTAMVKGEQLLNKRGLIYNEIYTLMWLGGIKDLPKALDVVLGRMLQEQWIVREGSGFAVKFIGRNRIENEFPRREAK